LARLFEELQEVLILKKKRMRKKNDLYHHMPSLSNVQG
jgi:hypothetical protein